MPSLPPGPETPPAAVAILRLDKPARGIGLILVATIFMSAGDVISKALSPALLPTQISWLRFASFFILVLAAAIWTGPPRIFATRHLTLQIVRGLTLVGSSVTFLTGLRYLPIAESTATSFIWPIFAMALSIPLLGEQVGIRRWIAAVFGLIGVAIVVRPGTSAFQLASLLPLLSALIWSFAIIVTRQMSADEQPMTTLAYSALIGFVALTCMLPFGWREPTGIELLFGVLIGALSGVGHFLVIVACRYCTASVLAPFFYAQLLWAVLLGIVFLDSVPDVWTVAGGAVIAASGLYTAHRERVRARERLIARPGNLS